MGVRTKDGRGALRQIKHLLQIPFTDKFFQITTFSIAVYQSNLSTLKAFLIWLSLLCRKLQRDFYDEGRLPRLPHWTQTFLTKVKNLVAISYLTFSCLKHLLIIEYLTFSYLNLRYVVRMCLLRSYLYPSKQCCGSVTFWFVSDPAIFVSDLQDGN